MTPAEFKEARVKLGLSPVACAARLGYTTQSRISEIEHGDRVPKQAAIIMQLLLILPRKKWPEAPE